MVSFVLISHALVFCLPVCLCEGSDPALQSQQCGDGKETPVSRKSHASPALTFTAFLLLDFNRRSNLQSFSLDLLLLTFIQSIQALSIAYT